METINKIYNFWFDKTLDYDKWFYNSKKYDKYITKKFQKVLLEGESGNLLEWLNNSKSYLTFIILLDQFSRHIYRNTSEAYKNDRKALLFTEMGLDIHLDKLTAIEKIFVLMPYQHSEQLEDQKFGKKMLENLVRNESNPKEKNILKKGLYYQKKKHGIIRNFGRFPNRNKILNREFTEEEIDFLDEEDYKIN